VTRPTPEEARAADLRVARLHLRLGSLGLARAELEAMAGGSDLDTDTLIDLAEARWRSGDLAGAGDAATAALEAGTESAIAHVIAAEAAAAGRPGEARRLASRALELSGPSISAVFAGMPRASIWSTDASEEGTATVPMFEGLGAPEGSSVSGPGLESADDLPAIAGQTGEGLWDDDASATDAETHDPATRLDSARAALAAGDQHAAALHLALALRLAPGVAPAVLDLLDTVDGPELTVVKGDAYRLVGHEPNALRAFANAAAAIAHATDKETM
jgi:hypothetical protein